MKVGNNLKYIKRNICKAHSNRDFRAVKSFYQVYKNKGGKLTLQQILNAYYNNL